MLVVDVEGEVSAASMVKDSKLYIEIAKFVQAYNVIVQNPNVFLSEIDEEPINVQKDSLTWEQFVSIINKCDFGFDPVPNSTQLAMYYSYAKQIGSISKEVKSIASVEDVAEAQKRYYNFIDDTTTKLENQYNKQHEITENRAQEATEVIYNMSKKKLKTLGILAAMSFGVLCFILGGVNLFFKIPFVRFFGFGNRYVGSIVLMVIGFLLFFFLDKIFLKFKYDFLKYKKDSSKIISRSEKTNKDDLILKDKLDKYKKDLKIAKYELADKNNSYDVEKCLENLRARNKWYQKLLGEDGEISRDKMAKLGNKELNLLDDMPFKDGFSGLLHGLFNRSKFENISAEELQNLSLFNISGMDASMLKDVLGKGGKLPKSSRELEELIADYKDGKYSRDEREDQDQIKRIETERLIQEQKVAQDIMNKNSQQGIYSTGTSSFDTPTTSKPEQKRDERRSDYSSDFVSAYNDIRDMDTRNGSGSNRYTETSGNKTTYGDSRTYDTDDSQGKRTGEVETVRAQKDNVSQQKEKAVDEMNFDELLNAASKMNNIDPEMAKRLRELQGDGMEM